MMFMEYMALRLTGIGLDNIAPLTDNLFQDTNSLIHVGIILGHHIDRLLLISPLLLGRSAYCWGLTSSAPPSAAIAGSFYSRARYDALFVFGSHCGGFASCGASYAVLRAF